MASQDEIPEKFLVHFRTLMAFSSVYQTMFWERHKQKLKAILSDNLSLIKAHEIQIAEELCALTRSGWQVDKIRVDLCIFGKSYVWSDRDRPYTTNNPTHIVMHANDRPHGNWYELLFHEASHHLISSTRGFVGGTIQDVALHLGVEVPRDLWHAYLFYFSGEVVKKVLRESHGTIYELYMMRNRVFSKFHASLVKYLPDYLSHTISLSAATVHILKEYRE